MKKRLIAGIMILALFALSLSGCSLLKGLERDVQVVLNVNGEYAGCVTVNIFNNAVLSEPEAPENKVFRGWTTEESWADEEADAVPILPNKGLVRYKDIESAVVGEALSVTLRAVFGPMPRRDLVIAWYAKESTSGLNQGHMDAFQEKLFDYLTSEGYKPDSMDILIRGYEGGVADTCAAIAKDGDVDLMVGWSGTNNLTSTGGWTEGVDFVENVGGITIGEKARYTARISDTELCLKVYAWVQNTFGAGAEPTVPVVQPTAEAVAPATEQAPVETVAAESGPAETVPAASENAETTPAETAEDVPSASENESDGKLVIGWYNKPETSGLQAGMMERLQAALTADLASLGFKPEEVEIVIRPYEGKVAEVQDAVLKDGDVDVMVGMKAFALEGIEMEVQEDVAMGEKTDRRIHLVSGNELAKAVFEWLKTDAARNSFKPE